MGGCSVDLLGGRTSLMEVDFNGTMVAFGLSCRESPNGGSTSWSDSLSLGSCLMFSRFEAWLGPVVLPLVSWTSSESRFDESSSSLWSASRNSLYFREGMSWNLVQGKIAEYKEGFAKVYLLRSILP